MSATDLSLGDVGDVDVTSAALVSIAPTAGCAVIDEYMDMMFWRDSVNCAQGSAM